MKSPVAATGSQDHNLTEQIGEGTHEARALTSRLALMEQEVRTLSAQLREKEREVDILSAQLAAKQSQLTEITASLGWQLLYRYSGLKYSYFSPIYNLLSRLILKKNDPGQDKQSPASSPQDNAAELISTSHSPETLDVICFSVINWEFRFQRPQQLLTQFAKDGHRVFYLRTNFHQISQSIITENIAENIYNIQLPGSTFMDLHRSEIDEGTLAVFLKALDEFREQAGIKEAVCLLHLPFWAPLAFGARERWGWKIVYDCMDEHSGFSNNRPTMLRHEEAAIGRSDLVVTTSRLLYEKVREAAKQTLLLPNAADFDHFSQPGPLNPLADLPRPIIGYFGAISEWFDVEMIREAASARPAWQFVLIGNAFGPDAPPLKRLQQLMRLRNVHLLGEQPYVALPSYLHQFDVTCIPFLVTPLTRATNPVKFYEYVSGGKPVVAVDLPELERYRDYFYPVRSAADFVIQIEAALEEQSPEKVQARIELARQNTWRNRYETLSARIKAL